MGERTQSERGDEVTTMTDEQLQQARVLESQATPGPWEYDQLVNEMVFAPDGKVIADVGGDTMTDADGFFIAASRTLVPALLAHIEAQAAELAALRTIAQGVVNRDWHRGDYEEGGTCDWCGYSQEPHWKNAPERHAHDCLYVAAKAAVEGQPYAERRSERDQEHG